MEIVTSSSFNVPAEIFQNIALYLKPEDLISCSKVSKFFNDYAADASYWKEIAKENEIPVDNTLGTYKSLRKYVVGLKTTIRSYPPFEEIPNDIATLSKDSNLPSSSEIALLKNYVQARDLLVVWEELGKAINNYNCLPKDVYQSSESVISKAGEFSNWCLQNQTVLSEIKYLNLIGRQLTTIPKEIGKLSSLQYLHLWRNRLTAIPKELGELSSLQELTLHNNLLESIPEELGKLSSLKRLVFSRNLLKSIPPKLGKLSSLESLELSFNQLISIPKEFGDLASLQKLDLYNNRLACLPAELMKLTSLKSCRLLYNPIKSYPKEFATSAVLMYDLYLSYKREMGSDKLFDNRSTAPLSESSPLFQGEIPRSISTNPQENTQVAVLKLPSKQQRLWKFANQNKINISIALVAVANFLFYYCFTGNKGNN